MRFFINIDNTDHEVKRKHGNGNNGDEIVNNNGYMDGELKNDACDLCEQKFNYKNNLVLIKK